MSTLIVVANGTEARLLCTARRSRPGELQEVAHLVRPTARHPARDLTTDRQGRAFPRAGRGGVGPPVASRSAVSDSNPHEVEIERFARRISRRLDALRRETGCEDLVVIAAPRFLGTLRGVLRGVTRDLVSREVPRDLVRAEDRQIRDIAFE
jgi:protein required for attachment to host cells